MKLHFHLLVKSIQKCDPSPPIPSPAGDNPVITPLTTPNVSQHKETEPHRKPSKTFNLSLFLGVTITKDTTFPPLETNGLSSAGVFPQSYAVSRPIMSFVSPPPSTPAKDTNLPQLETYEHFSAGVFPQNYVVSGSVMPRYALSILCEKMDGVGLRNYLFAHFKDRIKVQAELPGALRCAPEPGKMVLEALQGFHGGSEFNDAELKKVRKCCLMLMKQLRIANVWLSSKTREKALEAAREWKERLVATDSGNTLVALGFLHLVAAFGLVSEFILDELVDCSLGATIHEDFPELCRITGLADRVPDIVQKLINRGKHILAVKYVFEFNLVDKISPVAILKDCVEESKELSKRLTEEGKTLIETTAREIHALKSVIKTIEYHKLESEYPRAIVDQRIEEVRRHKSMIKKLKMKRRACAQASTAKLLRHQQHQPQQPQRKMQMQRQQQSEFKRPRTQTPDAVGHSATQKNNVNEGDSTMHQYQYCCEEPLVHPSVCLFQEHSNPYMNSTAVQFGMVDLSGGPYGNIDMQYYRPYYYSPQW